MSLRQVRQLAAIAIAFVLLTAQDCGGASFSTIVTGHSAHVSAENDASEVVFVLLYADDANIAGNLGSGASSTITTHVDGAYHVVVAGSGLQLGNYQASVALLREATQDLYSQRGATDQAKADDARARTATARQNLEGLFQTDLALASCVGTVSFKVNLESPPAPIEITATVTKSGTTWAATCPSQNQ